jgi:hypothetical protein
MLIGNKLEISERLYTVKVEESLQSLTKSCQSNITQISNDLVKFDLEFPDKVCKLVSLYILLRPDIGYISSMMPVADVLV